MYALGIAYNNNQDLWVAGGGATNSLAYSKDGFSWTGITGSTSLFSIVTWCVACSPTMWVAGGQGTTNSLAYSKDGFTWTGLSKNIISSNTMGVTYSSKRDLWVAVGNGPSVPGNTLAYSKDGVTWTGSGKGVVYSEGDGIAYSTYLDIWVAVGGSGGNNIAYSSDAINWTGVDKTVFSPGSGLGVTYSNNQQLWTAAGSGAGNTLAYSTNGINWTGRGTSIFSTGVCVAYSDPTPVVALKTSAMNIQNWYNPDNVTITSGYVTAWNDSLGAYNLGNATVVGANTMTVVVASGTSANVVYQSNTSPFTNYSYLYGGAFSETVYSVTFCCNTTAYDAISTYYFDTILCSNVDDTACIRFTVTNGATTLNVGDLNYNGSTYMNGTLVQSGNSITLKSSVPTGYTIYCVYLTGTMRTTLASLRFFGGNWSGGPGKRGFTGYSGDLFIGNASFGTTQQQQLEGYLGYKYKCQSSLPTNHPYYSSTNSNIVTLSVG